jgi:hypothetical protein
LETDRRASSIEAITALCSFRVTSLLRRTKLFSEAPLYQAKPLEGVSFADPGLEGTKEDLPVRKREGLPVSKDLERHCSEWKRSLVRKSSRSPTG